MSEALVNGSLARLARAEADIKDLTIDNNRAHREIHAEQNRVGRDMATMTSEMQHLREDLQELTAAVKDGFAGQDRKYTVTMRWVIGTCITVLGTGLAALAYFG